MINSYLAIGKIVGVHGVKGEMKVLPLTSDVRRFKKLKSCALVKNIEKISASDINCDEYKIISSRNDKQMVLIKFDGIDDRDIAARYKDLFLVVDREMAIKPKKDEYFIVDLIGLDVIDEKLGLLGNIADVFETGANFIVKVKRKNKKDMFIPYLKDVCYEVDLEDNTFKVRLPDGLYEIYE